MWQSGGSVLLSVFLAVAFTLAATTKTAYAYMDPGSGSMIIQILLATLLGSLFMLKAFWHRFTGNLARLKAKIKGTKSPME